MYGCHLQPEVGRAVPVVAELADAVERNLRPLLTNNVHVTIRNQPAYSCTSDHQTRRPTKKTIITYKRR